MKQKINCDHFYQLLSMHFIDLSLNPYPLKRLVILDDFFSFFFFIDKTILSTFPNVDKVYSTVLKYSTCSVNAGLSFKLTKR